MWHVVDIYLIEFSSRIILIRECLSAPSRVSFNCSGVEKINGTMGSRDCFSKVLPNIKLATRFDADGKEVQVIIIIIWVISRTLSECKWSDRKWGVFDLNHSECFDSRWNAEKIWSKMSNNKILLIYWWRLAIFDRESKDCQRLIKLSVEWHGA